MADPKPCRFDHGNSGQAIAGLGDALAAASLAAVIGAGRYSDIARYLPAIDIFEVKAVTPQANPHHELGGAKKESGLKKKGGAKKRGGGNP